MPNQPLEKKVTDISLYNRGIAVLGNWGWTFVLVLHLLLLVRATNSFWIGATATLPDERYAPFMYFLQLMNLCYSGILDDSRGAAKRLIVSSNIRAKV